MGCHRCLIYTRLIFYISVIAIHGTNGIVLLNSFDEENLKIKEVQDFKKTKFFFFTCWTFLFQIAYAILGIICDWVNLQDAKRIVLPEIVSKCRENVFTIIVWPSATMVATYFWSFYIYDRNLLYPEYFDTVITGTSNHILHTLILPIAFCELILYPKLKPENSCLKTLCVVGMEVVYLCSLFYTYYTKGIWVYPLFATLYENKFHLAILLVFTALYLSVLYHVQFCVSSIVLKCRAMIGKKCCKATVCKK